MIAKGRYVGQLILDVAVDLDACGVTVEDVRRELREYHSGLKKVFERMNCGAAGVEIDAMYTRMYMDVYETEGAIDE